MHPLLCTSEWVFSGCNKRDTDIIQRRLSVNPVTLNLIWQGHCLLMQYFITIHTHTHTHTLHTSFVYSKGLDEISDSIAKSISNIHIVNVIPFGKKSGSFREIAASRNWAVNVQNYHEISCHISWQQGSNQRLLESYQKNFRGNIKRYTLVKEEKIWASIRKIIAMDWNSSKTFKLMSFYFGE